jgi:4-amino-4-deoxy-L-arabinose transferase-like glycosyltransferase
MEIELSSPNQFFDSPNKARLFLIAYATILFGVGLNHRDLWASHEARAAQNAISMLQDNAWLIPHLLDGTEEFQKPPGIYWAIAGISWLRGGIVDGWSVRLPSAISGVLLAILLHTFLCRFGRPRAAWYATILFVTANHVTGLARVGRIDLPFTLMISSCLIWTWMPRTNAKFAILMIAFSTMAGLLLKGPLVIALAASVSFLVWFRCTTDFIQPTIRRLIPGLILGSLLALPWFVAAHIKTDGQFTQSFFLHHYIDRALGNSNDLATHPWWLYLLRFPIDFLPGSMFLPMLWLHRKRSSQDHLSQLGICWFLGMLSLLSFSSFKRADYLTPAYIGLSIWMGSYLSSIPFRRQHGYSIAWLGLTLVGWLGYETIFAPRQEAVRDQRVFAAEIRNWVKPEQTVIFHQVESHLLAYHLGRPIQNRHRSEELTQQILEGNPTWFVCRVERLEPLKREFPNFQFLVHVDNRVTNKVKPERALLLIEAKCSSLE